MVGRESQVLCYALFPRQNWSTESRERAFDLGVDKFGRCARAIGDYRRIVCRYTCIYPGAKVMESKEHVRAVILKKVEHQLQETLMKKYGWKRELSKARKRLFKHIGYWLFRKQALNKPDFDREVFAQTPNLGEDDFGRDVAEGMLKYVELLKNRGLKVHTVLVLGSRVKWRWKPESDVDVTVIASNLPRKSFPSFPSLVQEITSIGIEGIKRWLLLSDRPIFIGVETSGCCSGEEFLQRLEDFDLLALDAMYYGKVIYDDGFWVEAKRRFKEMEEKYRLHETQLKRMLLPK